MPRYDQPSYVRNENRYVQKNYEQLNRYAAPPVAPPKPPQRALQHVYGNIYNRNNDVKPPVYHRYYR